MEKKTSSKKNNEKGNNMKILQKPVALIVYSLVIVLISLAAFFGIYVQDKNQMKNILPDYKLGSDIYGKRDVLIKPSEDISLGDELEVEATSEEEKEKVSETSKDDYKKSKDIIVKRLKALGVKNYEIKFDEDTGIIRLDIPEDDQTDIIAQYSVTTGKFKIKDTETEEVLLNNSNIKKVSYDTYAGSSSGTTVYMTIEFNKEGTEKLKEISNTYVKSTDEEGNDTSKTITMTIDSSTILSSSFEEEISNGIVQLTIGTSSDTAKLEEYTEQAKRIAILLNSGNMPVSYNMEVNRFVYSDVTKESLKTIIIVAAAIFALMIVYMIVKYRLAGLVAGLTNIGLLAVYLIVLRYANVNMTLLGMFGVALITIMDYVLLLKVLKVNKEDIDKDEKKEKISKIIKNSFELLIPVGIIAIIFALTSWETLISLGTVLFWGILIMILYSLLTFKIIFMNKKSKKPERKQEFHQM